MSTFVVGEHPLAGPLCTALSSLGPVRHEPEARDPTGASTEPWPDWAQGSAAGSGSETAQNALVAGVATVVLLPVDPASPNWLDLATRGTYDLLRAAVVAGAKKVVCISSMALLDQYADNLLVDVQYAPKPSTEPGPLGCHLQEFICREFGRLGLLQTVIARLGSPNHYRWPLEDNDAVAAVVEVLTPGWRPQQLGDINELTPPVNGDELEDLFRDHMPWRYTVLHLHNGWPYNPMPALATAEPAPEASPPVAPVAPAGRVLVLGGNGMLGPPVSAELSKPDSGVVMTVTDINPPPDSAPTLQLPHKSEILSITDAEGVAALAEESDAIVNCAVMRPDRRLAFSVNVQGTYNAISAAAGAGHRRFINTGPHFSIVGQTYEDFDFGLTGAEPSHPGVYLYAITKGLGQEICRVFAANNPSLQVIHLMYYHFKRSLAEGEWTPASGSLVNALGVTFADGAKAVAAALKVDTTSLESNCEAFFVGDDMPNGRFLTDRTKKYLNWAPTESIAKFFTHHPKL